MKTDAQIQRDVLAELQWEPSVRATGIGVAVQHGVVKLSGHVDSFWEKYQAERTVQRVAGVRALVEEIDVKLSGSAKSTDAEIADSVEEALQSCNALSNDHVKVKVESGKVTLTGDVDWDYQRKAAVAAVGVLYRVTGINDLIRIKPKISVSVVKSEIEAALARRAHTDGQAIAVAVDGAQVTLTGKVHSWSERDLATSSAWGTAGVYKVVNNVELIG